MLTPEDEAAIKSLHEEDWVQHVLARDIDSLVTLYADDVVVMAPNMPAIEGLEAFREFVQAFPPITTMDMTVLHVEGKDDLAFVWGKTASTMEIEGTTVSDSNNFVELLRKQPNGSWRIAYDIWNSDVPLPE